jgi:hypothetical protein
MKEGGRDGGTEIRKKNERNKEGKIK